MADGGQSGGTWKLRNGLLARKGERLRDFVLEACPFQGDWWRQGKREERERERIRDVWRGIRVGKIWE